MCSTKNQETLLNLLSECTGVRSQSHLIMLWHACGETSPSITRTLQTDTERHPGTNAIFSDNLTGFKIAFHLYTPYQFHAVPIYAFDKVKSFILKDSPGIESGWLSTGYAVALNQFLTGDRYKLHIRYSRNVLRYHQRSLKVLPWVNL